jgi:hypothetical protein
MHAAWGGTPAAALTVAIVARLTLCFGGDASAAGALEPSLADYNTILQLEPGNVDAMYYRGTVYEKLGLLDEAISDFSAVLTLDPNHIKASYARGACRNLKGDFQKAIGEQQLLAGQHTCTPAPLHVLRVVGWTSLGTKVYVWFGYRQRVPELRHCAVLAAEDYTYALERDKKPSRTHRSSRSNKLISLREGLLSKSATSTGDAAGAAASGLNSLTLSTATSSDIGSVLNVHDDGEQPTLCWGLFVHLGRCKQSSRWRPEHARG